MRKIIILMALLFTTCAAGFSKDLAEGYWISYDENSNEITAAWKFYINVRNEMEAVIVYSPGCDATTISQACKNMKPVQNFPVEWNSNGMKVLYDTPWIYGLKKVGEGSWDNGFIIDSGEGKKYNCKITFQPADGDKYKSDTLVMRGSIGPIGRSQFWRRPDSNTISTLKIQAKGITDFIDMLENN